MRKRRPERAGQYESATYQELLVRLATNVRGLRERNRWTQEEAAHRCGMATQVLQRVEAGATNVTFTTLARLCDGFATDVSKLLGARRMTSFRAAETADKYSTAKND